MNPKVYVFSKEVLRANPFLSKNPGPKHRCRSHGNNHVSRLIEQSKDLFKHRNWKTAQKILIITEGASNYNLEAQKKIKKRYIQ